MRKLVDFRMVESFCQTDTGEFASGVFELIQEGFELHGQVFVTGRAGQETMHQAMAKYEDIFRIVSPDGNVREIRGAKSIQAENS